MFLVWIAALGCGPSTEPGTLAATADGAACLAVEGTVLPGGDGTPGPHTVDVDAVAISEAEPSTQVWDWGVRCDNVERVLTVQDAAGGQWHVGWGWAEGGLDQTPGTTLGPNDAVHLRVRWVDDLGQALGFVVTDAADRVVLALEMGTWGSALVEGDVPGLLPMASGEITGTERDDCGVREARELLFDGGVEQVALEAIDNAPLNVGGQQTTAWALANLTWRDSDCESFAGETSWAIVR